VNFQKASNEVLRDLFLDHLRRIARELGLTVPTALIADGFGDKPEKLIELNLSEVCGVSVTAHSGLLLAHESVATTVHKFLGEGDTWEEVHDSETLNIVMAPFLKELWRRLHMYDAEMIKIIGIAA